MVQMDSTIITSDDSGVRTITLNRPDVLNAFNTELLKELSQAVRAAEKDKSVRCLVLTGQGRGFSAGQDLADVAERYKTDDPIELGHHLRKFYNPLIVKLRAMEKPVIASVNGVAAGAGCSLALAADLRIGCRSASIVPAFINIGLIPDAGGTHNLQRIVGYAKAAEIWMLGEKVSAEEAYRIGLFNRLVEDDELMPKSMELARRLASMPTRGIGLTKRGLNRAWNSTLDDQLEYEAFLQQTAGMSEDHREGVLAFIEKRKPAFKGR